MKIPAVSTIHNKEEARSLAIWYSNKVSQDPMSWQEVAEWSDFFSRLGNKYHLTSEFEENGII